MAACIKVERPDAEMQALAHSSVAKNNPGIKHLEGSRGAIAPVARTESVPMDSTCCSMESSVANYWRPHDALAIHHVTSQVT